MTKANGNEDLGVTSLLRMREGVIQKISDTESQLQNRTAVQARNGVKVQGLYDFMRKERAPQRQRIIDQRLHEAVLPRQILGGHILVDGIIFVVAREVEDDHGLGPRLSSGCYYPTMPSCFRIALASSCFVAVLP